MKFSFVLLIALLPGKLNMTSWGAEWGLEGSLTFLICHVYSSLAALNHKAHIYNIPH